jgi:hypothetical protein
VLLARRSTRSTRSPSAIITTTATRGGRRLASPLTKTRRPSRRGAVMSPVRRSTGATCRGRPHHRPLATLKCRHRRASRRRLGATRPWARAHDRRLVPPERTSGRSVLVGCPAGRVPPRCRDPPRRSEEWPTSACQLYDGSDRPDSDSLQRRRSRGRLSDSASTPSVPPMVEPSTALRRLQSLLIRGGGAPDVHVALVAGRGHGLTPTVAEVGGSAPERAGRVLPLLRRQAEVEQPSRWRARSAQPSSRRGRNA